MAENFKFLCLETKASELEMIHLSACSKKRTTLMSMNIDEGIVSISLIMLIFQIIHSKWQLTVFDIPEAAKP